MALPPSEIDADVMRATDRLLEIPNLQASFENREVLEGEDRGIIRQLGLKFRGRNAWPMFRSYRPGFFPWLIDSHEAELLTCALEQVLVVAPRLGELLRRKGRAHGRQAHRAYPRRQESPRWGCCCWARPTSRYFESG